MQKVNVVYREGAPVGVFLDHVNIRTGLDTEVMSKNLCDLTYAEMALVSKSFMESINIIYASPTQVFQAFEDAGGIDELWGVLDDEYERTRFEATRFISERHPVVKEAAKRLNWDAEKLHDIFDYAQNWK